LTVPSATRLASTVPVKTLVIDPTRISVSPSGSLPLPSAISPKPTISVLPSLMTPITSPGTWLSRKSTWAGSSIASRSTLSAASAETAPARIHADAAVARTPLFARKPMIALPVLEGGRYHAQAWPAIVTLAPSIDNLIVVL